jgi:hypothetical protein
MMMAQLVSELDRRGVLSKTEFADGLARLADLGETGVDVGGDHLPRFDLMTMRNCVAVLRDEEPEPGGWTPRVIDGGKAD